MIRRTLLQPYSSHIYSQASVLFLKKKQIFLVIKLLYVNTSLKVLIVSFVINWLPQLSRPPPEMTRSPTFVAFIWGTIRNAFSLLWWDTHRGKPKSTCTHIPKTRIRYETPRKRFYKTTQMEYFLKTYAHTVQIHWFFFTLIFDYKRLIDLLLFTGN